MPISAEELRQKLAGLRKHSLQKAPGPAFGGRIISRVRNATETKTSDIAVRKVLEAIRTGGERLKGQITQIRSRFESELEITGSDLKAAKHAVDPLKKALPAVTWSGTFSKRANDKLVQHSGLICADLDSLGELVRIREKLKTSCHLGALYVSPTGHGLKAVFRVPADASKHAASFRAVEQHVRELTGVQIDQACKEPARLCFMSFDPELYHNPNATELEPLPEPEKGKASVSRSAGRDSKPSKAQIREMLAVIPKRPDYHNWIEIVAAVGDALDLPDAVEVLDEWSEEEEPGEYAKKLASSFSEIHVGTLVHLAREHGWTGQIGTPRAKVDLWACAESEPLELPPPPAPYVPPPLDLLPSVLQDYVHAAAESLTVDVAYVLLPMLSAIASAIGNSRSILLKPGYIEPPVIWTGIIGNISSRKSPSIQLGCFAVSLHERELVRQNTDAKEQFAEELAQWEAAKKTLRGDKPEPPMIATCKMDDLTLEALADRLEQNPRGVLVAKDELSHWLASFDQYRTSKGSDVSRWLSIHTGVEFGIDRRSDNRHYRIWMPRVSITGGIQPKVLRRVLTEDYFERGLPARFLLAYPKFHKARWSEVTIPDDLTKAVRDLFDELWLLQPNRDEWGHSEPILLRPDDEAKAEFIRYYNECGDWAAESNEREEAAWGKLSGYAARLALIGQLIRNFDSEIVTADTVRAACEFSQWCGVEDMRIYATLAETPEQRDRRRFIDFIVSRGGAVTVRDVITYYWPLRKNSAEAERQLYALARAGLGVWKEVKGARGPATREFQLLQSPTSAGFSISPSIAPEPADADAPSSQEITSSREPDTEAEILACKSKLLQPSASAGFSNSPGQIPKHADADPSNSQERTDSGEPKSEAVSGDLQL
jgi:Protein of unknown function (DUF3987)/BT4734-like, N-terminal domain